MNFTLKSSIYLLGVVFVLTNCKRPFARSANLKNYDFLFQQNENEFAGKVSVTFFGTSTLLFDDGETQIMIDGFLSRPSTFKVAFGKVKTNEAFIDEVLTFHDINRLKGIFVCHSHYDHVMDAPYISQKTGASLYGSSSTLNVGKGTSLRDSLMVEFKEGDKIQLGKFSIEVINSIHTPPFKILGKSNATDPCHPNITEPLSQPAKSSHFIEGGTYDFYITYDNEKHIMVKASTNYINGKLINYPTDIFFLGIAMLGKMDKDFQEIYYRETVLATNAQYIIPIHWDNFGKSLNKPLIALPNIGDNVSNALDFLIQKTNEDSRNLQMLQGHERVVLF